MLQIKSVFDVLLGTKNSIFEQQAKLSPILPIWNKSSLKVSHINELCSITNNNIDEQLRHI